MLSRTCFAALCLLSLSLGATHNVTVKSAGYDSGGVAEFSVDGKRLSAPMGRGMNVAVLQTDSTLRDFGTFDTHADGSEALVRFIAQLPSGSTVLIATVDEAQGNISAEATSAIASCGASKIDALTYRGAYALIGVKGGAALAEQAAQDGGTAEASASGALAPASVQVEVRSSGSDGDNFGLAQFSVNDVPLVVAPGRGINMAVVDAAGAVVAFRNFDTHGDGSEALAAFVDDLAPGSLVLMAVMDEAQGNLSQAAARAIADCGAAHIADLAYRGSYALAGVKGGSVLAEQALPSGGGVATASARHTFAAPRVSMAVESYRDDAAANVSFWVGGELLAVTPGRGINLVVLDASGQVASFGSFDTHAAGSDDLAAALGALPFGATVLVAALDEAQGNMSAAAAQALAGCGAELVQSIGYRGAYALIGVRGGAALAEEVAASGRARAAGSRAVVREAHAGPSTTTTTTTPAPQTCQMALCPAGSSLNASRVNATLNLTACCAPTASEAVVDVAVHSTGYSDGPEATFFVAGRPIFSTPPRGITVVTLRPDGTRLSSETFDTFGDDNASAALAEHLAAIEDGVRVLVGIADEGSAKLTNAGRDALRALGAQLAQEIGWRSGYALIATKGGGAQSEMVRAEGQGCAVAVAQMELVAEVEADLPVCDAKVPEPPTQGYLSSGNLVLDAACRYPLWDRPATSSCLQASWISIFGSSNTLLEFGNLVNLLAPGEYDVDRPGEKVGASAMVDVVIKDGSVVHWETVDGVLPACKQVNKGEAAANAPECRAAMEGVLAKAPAFDAGAIRITMFLSFFWDRMNLALDVLQAGAAWSSAKMSLVVQIGAWYNVCAVTKEAYCPRKELLDMDRDTAIGVFKADMEESLAKLDTFCAPDGRAGELGCSIQTISWTNSVGDNENFKVMNGYIREAMAPRMSKSLRLIDFFSLGGGMPEEVVNGHGSQMLNLWVWQVMLNSMCPAELAAEGSYAKWDGKLCSGTEAQFENCPKYYPSCEQGPRCERWECMNSVPCTLVPTAPPVMRDIQGLCAAPVRLANATPRAAAGAQGACVNSKGLRTRAWCQEGVEWVLPLAFVPLAGLALAAGSLKKRRGAAKEAEAAAKARQQEPPSHGAGGTLLASPRKADKEEAVKDAAQRSDRSPLPEAANDGDGGAADPSAEGAGHVPPLSARSVQSKWAKRRMDASGAVEETGGAADDAPSAPGDDGADTSGVAAAGGAADAAPSAPGDDGAPSEHVVDIGAAEVEEPSAIAKAHVATGLWARLPTMPLAGNRYPLGLARFLGSLHVVVGHLYAKGGVVANEFFFGWGFTWVPWFFMLSGFVLFSAHLKNPKQERMFDYVMRRTVTIYPLYAFSVVVAFAMQKAVGTMQASAVVLVAQSFLVQAWWPGWTDSALQMHCWFLSCMVVYWFFFKPLAWCFKGLNLLRTLTLMAALFALPWLSILVPLIVGESPDWYANPEVRTDQALQMAITTLKFHPVCYAHVFALGMLLAKLRSHLDAKATLGRDPRSWSNPWRWAVQFIAPCGYLGLLLVFSVSALQPSSWGYKLSARLSVLLPFQAMVLLGLAGLPSLPMPFLAFAFSKLNFLENYSYSLYVFQFIAFNLWPQATDINLPLFLVFCVAFAVFLAVVVQQPIQRRWAAHPKARFVVPFVMAGALAGLSFLPDPQPVAPELLDIPATRRIDNVTVDVRLALADTEGGRDAAVINPSLLVHGGEVVVVARRHQVTTRRYVGAFNGSNVNVEEQVWHSEILMGAAALDQAAWDAWPASLAQPFSAELRAWQGLRTASGAPWAELCAKETYVPRNRTLIRHLVTGPEDPKAVPGAGGVTVVFDSRPPGGAECRTDQAGMLDAVSQMYLATRVQVPVPSEEVAAYHLTYGQRAVAEKNWIPFVYGGELRFVYTPQPHVIVAAQANGTSEKLHSTSFRPLQQLLQEHPGLEARGSGQAVLVDDPAGTPRLPQRHYLALMHLFNKSSGVYSHFAYRFDAEPPFPVLQLSAQLPLTEAEATPGGVPFAFASGIAVANRTVAISYGAGDRDARALVMPLRRLDEMFACE